MHIIRDKHGRKYKVFQSDSAVFTRFNITHRGERVGYANCRVERDHILHLIDLHIRDTVIRPAWLFLYFLNASFPPKSWRTTHYRRLGVGTAMIAFLVSYGKSKHAKRIEGEVMPHDFKNNPKLPEWYRHRGFDVVMGGKNDGWVAKISRPI